MPADQEWFVRSPSVAVWIALGGVVALIALHRLVLHRRPTTDRDTVVVLVDRLWRLALIVAFVPAVPAEFSNATALAITWWLIAGGAFASVLLVTVGLAVVLLAHARGGAARPAPPTRGTLPYRMTMVLERREGRWLLIQVHGSSPH